MGEWCAYHVRRLTTQGNSYFVINVIDGNKFLVELDASQPNSNGTVLVDEAFVKEKIYKEFSLSNPTVSYDGKYLLFAVDRKSVCVNLDISELQIWRHSFYANYLIFDVEKQTGEWLTGARQEKPTITNAVWRPNSYALAYVVEGNIWIQNEDGTQVQVTTDGNSENYFNGVQSWVYEEEIFSDYNALWWSPDGTHLAFMKSNQSQVPMFHIPMYEGDRVDLLNIPYPKAGDVNPTVSACLYKVDTKATTVVPRGDDEYITGVMWGPNSEKLFVRTLNRLQNEETLWGYEVASSYSESYSTQQQQNGWVETRPFKFISNNQFLYIRPNNGFFHISLATLNNGTVSDKFLTSGSWDVLSVSGWDAHLQTVYYLSSQVHPTERHLCSVTVDGLQKNITNTSLPGYYGASFNNNATYYVLSYLGPDVPTYSLWTTSSTEAPLKVLEDNKALKSLIEDYYIPPKEFFTADGVHDKLNAFVLRARGEGISPVLFDVYGGPGSQTVTKTFSLGFDQVLASSFGISVVSVGMAYMFYEKPFSACYL